MLSAVVSVVVDKPPAYDWTPWISAASALIGALIGAAAGVIGPLLLEARRRKADDAARAKAIRGEAILDWTTAAVELANVHEDEAFTSVDYREPAARSNAAMAKLRMSLTASGDIDVREFARQVHGMTTVHWQDGTLERRVVARGSDMLMEWHETGAADFRPFAFLPKLVIGETWADAFGAARAWFSVYELAAKDLADGVSMHRADATPSGGGEDQTAASGQTR